VPAVGRLSLTETLQRNQDQGAVDFECLFRSLAERREEGAIDPRTLIKSLLAETRDLVAVYLQDQLTICS